MREISKRSKRPRFAKSWDTLLSLKFFQDYDRVIYLDADMICMHLIDELFNEKYNEYPMLGVKSHNNDYRLGGFNGGIYVFNRIMLNDKVFEDICNYAIYLDSSGYDMGNAEQTTINEWIKKNDINCHNLGIEKWMCTDFKYDSDAKFIHYIGKKPWIHKVDTDVYKIWHSI